MNDLRDVVRMKDGREVVIEPHINRVPLRVRGEEQIAADQAIIAALRAGKHDDISKLDVLLAAEPTAKPTAK